MARLIVPLQDMERRLMDLRDLSDRDYEDVILLMNDCYYRGSIAESERQRSKCDCDRGRVGDGIHSSSCVTRKASPA